MDENLHATIKILNSIVAQKDKEISELRKKIEIAKEAMKIVPNPAVDSSCYVCYRLKEVKWQIEEAMKVLG